MDRKTQEKITNFQKYFFDWAGTDPNKILTILY